MYTSWRFAEGDLPYRDFALPHLPLAPLYYAGATGVIGPSLYGLRAFNVALFLLGAGGLGLAAHRRWGPTVGFLTAVFYLSSSLTVTWLVPVKAYAPAVTSLALAAAVWIWPGRREGVGYVRAAVVGLFLGLATLARLPLLVTVAAAAFGLWFNSAAGFGGRLGRVGALCLGFLAVAPIVVYFRVAAGDAFAFNVWGIHELFIGDGGAGRGAAVASLFKPPDPAILIVAAAIALGSRHRRVLSFPLAAGALLLIANLAPGTTQRQYFVPMAAALAPAAGVGAEWLWERRRDAGAVLVAAAAFLGVMRPAAKVALDRAHKELVGPAEVYAAAALLAEHSSADDAVFTAWPGYAALARRRVIAGWELGYFTHRIGERLGEAERRRYHLTTYDETAEVLKRGDAVVALDALDTPEKLRPVLYTYFEGIDERRGATLWRFRGSR